MKRNRIWRTWLALTALAMTFGSCASAITPSVRYRGFTVERLRWHSVRWNHDLQGMSREQLLHGLRDGGWADRHCLPKNRIMSPDGTLYHAQMVVFDALDNGIGPAARGDYLVQIPDSSFEEATGGERTLVFEQYRIKATHNYAWVMWLSDRDLSPRCP